MLTIAGGILLAILGLIVIVAAIIFWPVTIVILLVGIALILMSGHH
jgi:hypothetical protein